jgi:hypothetical protein
VADIKKDVMEVVASIKEVPNAFARASGMLDGFMQEYTKSVIRRHRNIAGLLNAPDEMSVRDDTIRALLETDVVADGDHQERLDNVESELRSGIHAACEAVKDFEVLCRYWSAEHQRLTMDAHAAEMRVAEITARIKEHALHNAEVRETVWKMTDGKCFYCEVELIRCGSEEQDRSRCYHIDHIVPKSSGGPDHISNYVPACERCNISKNAKSFVEFLAWRKAQQAPPQLMLIEGGAA